MRKIETDKRTGRAIALLPIGVFLIVFLGAGVVTGDFYAMPAIEAFLLALFVAFMQNKSLIFDEKIKVIAKGIGNENIITMSLIFLCAGGFSGIVTAAGGAESTVNLGLSLLPVNIIVTGLFIIGCFVSLSMGTSMGTIAALAPIALQISEKTGFSTAICIGAVVCGSMFGDNLSMISDTTIAAVKTQGCEMKDKFKANFLIVLPAAIITAIIFLAIAKTGNVKMDLDLTYNFWLVLPYILVLVGALVGINVFIVLLIGIVTSLATGVFSGTITIVEGFSAIGDGITGMYDITVISIIVAAIVALVKEYGGIDFILSLFRRKINGNRGGQIGIAGLTLLVDMCTANNTVAIVIAGPIAKEISDEFEIDPKRSASLLDIFASVGQGLIPYGAQLLSAATLTALTPFDIMPYMYYPILMLVSATLFIILGKQKIPQKVNLRNKELV